jgi:hypothetical protein
MASGNSLTELRALDAIESGRFDRELIPVLARVFSHFSLETRMDTGA